MRPRTDHESVTVFWCMRPYGHAVSAFFADFSVFKRIFSYFSSGWRPCSARHWFSALRASRSFLKCVAAWCGSWDRRPRSWRFRTCATALVFLLFFSFGKENQKFASWLLLGSRLPSIWDHSRRDWWSIGGVDSFCVRTLLALVDRMSGDLPSIKETLTAARQALEQDWARTETQERECIVKEFCRKTRESVLVSSSFFFFFPLHLSGCTGENVQRRCLHFFFWIMDSSAGPQKS